MKKMLFLFILLILITSCSGKRTILRNAEKYFKEHIGNSDLYKRIEWWIADTTFLNDLKSPTVLGSIKNEKLNLDRLEHSASVGRENIKNTRYKISKCINGVFSEKTYLLKLY
jgi:hypothetical protein